MYVVRYQHGTIAESRMGSQRADLTFGNIVKGLTQNATYKLVRYSPHNAWFVCDRPSHIARLNAEGVPCIALAIQQERGSIPHGWENPSV